MEGDGMIIQLHGIVDSVLGMNTLQMLSVVAFTVMEGTEDCLCPDNY
jgi:hypothetical protein